MIDWGKIGCHWRTKRHGGTFQNVLQRTADRFVEIGFDKRGRICFYKFTYDFPCMDRVRNIFLGKSIYIFWWHFCGINGSGINACCILYYDCTPARTEL